MSEVAVALAGVTKRFDAVTAVDEVSLEVERGEFLTLLGPSGCGKTTILNIVAGFAIPDAGAVTIGGASMEDMPPYRRSIGLVFQNYALFPHMGVLDNVAFGLRMRRVGKAEARRRAGEALELVRLSGLGDRRPRQLSGGQQQRVALARALVIRPEVLLLDEPLSALDKNLRADMQVELKAIQRQVGVTTIFVTHDQSEALSLSDRIAVMNEGRLQQLATPADTYRRPANGFVASFIGDINRLPGRIVAADAGEIRVALANGREIAVPRDGTASPPSGEVAFFIRPEALSLARSDAEDGIVAMAVVRAHNYQGTHVDILCEAADIGPLRVRAQRYDAMAAWPPGTPVAIRADRAEALVFAR